MVNSRIYFLKKHISFVTVQALLEIVIARPRSGRGNPIPLAKGRDCSRRDRFVAPLLAMTVAERLLSFFIQFNKTGFPPSRE
jgi:hypothetical protein